MKKILPFIFVLLIAFSAILYAQEDIDAPYFNNGNGSIIRLLQLEKSIERNIDSGNVIIEDLKSQNYSVEKLESLIVELKVIKSQLDYNLSLEQFLNLKKDAIVTSNEFKTEARKMFKENEIQKVKEKIKEKVDKNDKIKDLDKKIKNHIYKYNSEKLLGIFQIINYENETLREKVLNGSINKGEVVKTLRENINSMNRTDKKDTLNRLKESNIKDKINANRGGRK